MTMSALDQLRHAYEYDPTFPGGLPYYCVECHEGLREGQDCAHNALLEQVVLEAREGGGGASACVLCGHPKHGPTDCGEVVGYDHLNGDHECGCPGDDLHRDPWVMERVGTALDAIRHADHAGLEAELDLLAFAEDVLRHVER